MNREIKFRGISVETGLFLYGVPLVSGKHAFIITTENRACDLGSRVKPETVSQYTGLKDKNGVEIYEGDIIDAGFLMDDLLLTDSGVVVFKDFRFIVEHPNFGDEDLIDWTLSESIKVIGNIYENPELLKEDTNEQIQG